MDFTAETRVRETGFGQIPVLLQNPENIALLSSAAEAAAPDGCKRIAAIAEVYLESQSWQIPSVPFGPIPCLSMPGTAVDHR